MEKGEGREGRGGGSQQSRLPNRGVQVLCTISGRYAEGVLVVSCNNTFASNAIPRPSPHKKRLYKMPNSGLNLKLNKTAYTSISLDRYNSYVILHKVEPMLVKNMDQELPKRT